MPRHCHCTAILTAIVTLLLVSCGGPEALLGPSFGGGGKGDAPGTFAARESTVILTAPYCDVCSAADKELLKQRSSMTATIVKLIDEATESVDIAQFTFSVDAIKDAILRAHVRPGVRVRMAMNSGTNYADSASRELLGLGVDVRYIQGKVTEIEGELPRIGSMHTKFLLVDGKTLLNGSNNWSSTGTTINEENAILLRSTPDDPLLAGFRCHFEAIWESRLTDAGQCTIEGVAGFTPANAAFRLIRDGIRASRRTVDVIVHHLSNEKLLKELIKVAEDGRRVRVLLNDQERHAPEHNGEQWEALKKAGGKIRYKQTNKDLAQLLHHKLVIIDGTILINGSGNWSTSFYNNYENFVRYTDPRIVRPFRDLFSRLWTWSLTGESLDAGRTAAEQHASLTTVYFGNLHAHFAAGEVNGRLLDDGKMAVLDDLGQQQPVVGVSSDLPSAARYAFEYARDRGQMDFLALSPHCVDDRPDDPPDLASMSEAGYATMSEVAAAINAESVRTVGDGGAPQLRVPTFVALPSMEWSTNGEGNHVNVLGSTALTKGERGRFDWLYGEFLPGRELAGEVPILMFNHPRTARMHEEYLTGNWDRIFGINLLELPKAGQRNKKFNDYGLDDYLPLSGVRDSWIAGAALPDPAIVDATLQTIEAASSPFVRLMEVTVGQGLSIGAETPINPDLSVDEAGVVSRVTKVHRDWDDYLLRGFKLAPAASHDNHWANWGTGHTSRTAIAATELTTSALLDAIARRDVYASEDQNLTLRFYAGGRAPMGGELQTPHDVVEASLQVSDPDDSGPIRVTLYRGLIGSGVVEPVQELSVASGVVAQLQLQLPGVGRYFFYLEVTEVDADRMAWSAPIWIERLSL